ncbi:MAG: IS200/IS605 family transposase [Bacteroidales bacterium]|nr:IS200/IS605 family transposase [Bacteroidales bacterium]
MANTYTQLYVHCVFAVQGRYSLIHKPWNDDLYRYISGIVTDHGHKAYIINGMPDHVHMLVSMHPGKSLSDLMYNVKKSSSLWINQRRLVMGKFSWQEGYGAFTYSKSQIPVVANYIENQEQHHKGQSFKEEYIKLLDSFGVKYDEKYLFTTV